MRRPVNIMAAGSAGMLLAVLLPTLGAPGAPAQAARLDPATWRRDITAMVEAVNRHHPDPFRSVSARDFNAAVAALVRDLPSLSDKNVALRLAVIVGSLKDGHTRLSLPRRHPWLAYEPGHTGPDAPAHETLSFSSLPFRFYLFADGLHIVKAAAGFTGHIGARIVKFGDTGVKDAIAAVRPMLPAENHMGVKLLAADALAIPEALAHFGVISDPSRVTLTLERAGRVERVTFAPLPAGAPVAPVTPPFAPRPLVPNREGERKWHGRIPGQRAWYIRIDELEAFPHVFISDFMADALRRADNARARRILLDIRRNQGGTSLFNAAVVNALARSRFNVHGRLFVLTGRETFSAAALLMSGLEQYTQAIFVGEPAGARPSSFGDPKKMRLPGSGLTLRVSTLHWPSWLAGDFRPFIDTHIDAAPKAADYFAGRDGAIAAALEYVSPGGAVAQMVELFDKNKLQSGLVRFVGWLNTSTDEGHDAAAKLIAYGHRYLNAKELRKGRFMMTVASDYYPKNATARAGLGRALELTGDTDGARRLYRQALEIDPSNERAQVGLTRLADR